MRLIAIHNIFASHGNFQPDESFDLEDQAEALRLVAVGAAQIDPEQPAKPPVKRRSSASSPKPSVNTPSLLPEPEQEEFIETPAEEETE